MARTAKSDHLRQFVMDNLSRMFRSGGGGAYVELPAFELTARDYLQFAEQELTGTALQNRINCVAHLKRAADCQLDTFLHAYNLFDFVRRANLKFPAKLSFLNDVALFSSRSLARFNELRNRIEHDYHAPAIPDLEVFYDLVQALVSLLESAALLLAYNAETYYEVYSEPDSVARVGTFQIEYDRKIPAIRAEWKLDHQTHRFVVEPDERDDFTFFFKTFVLLGRRDCFRGDSFVLSQIAAGAA